MEGLGRSVNLTEITIPESTTAEPCKALSRNPKLVRCSSFGCDVCRNLANLPQHASTCAKPIFESLGDVNENTGYSHYGPSAVLVAVSLVPLQGYLWLVYSME